MRSSQLFYESVGSGEPLVLLHAGVADCSMWDEQVAAFAPRYRVIRFDAQGFGRSAAASEPETRADDVYGLLRTLEVGQAHVIGLSMGGGAAVDFALSYPEMVGALIAAAPGLSGFSPSDPASVEWIDEQEQRQAVLLEAGDLDGAAQVDLEIWLAGPLRSLGDMDSGLIERLRPMARLALARQPERARTPQIDPPALARLDQIDTPTLVMIGDSDVPFVLEVADILVERIRGAQKKVFANTAHMINMERPAEFNRAVLEFLAAHPLTV
jgi:3-oxoadipate enol-lactonase